MRTATDISKKCIRFVILASQMHGEIPKLPHPRLQYSRYGHMRTHAGYRNLRNQDPLYYNKLHDDE